MPAQVSEFLGRLSTPALIGLLGLAAIQLALQIWAIVDLVRRHSVRFNAKWMWALIIVCGGLLGLILYLAWGRLPYDPFEASSRDSPPGRDRIDAGVSRLYRDRDPR
jgi:hypothetical protein